MNVYWAITISTGITSVFALLTMTLYNYLSHRFKLKEQPNDIDEKVKILREEHLTRMELLEAENKSKMELLKAESLSKIELERMENEIRMDAMLLENDEKIKMTNAEYDAKTKFMDRLYINKITWLGGLEKSTKVKNIVVGISDNTNYGNDTNYGESLIPMFMKESEVVK
jgi:hypothetical protein